MLIDKLATNESRTCTGELGSRSKRLDLQRET